MTKLYIAGPMTGYEQWNFPEFFRVEKALLELGYDVINPAHNDGPDLESALASAGSTEKPNYTWNYYMKRDLPHVMECDGLLLLEGWQNSKGAKLEVHVAKALGLPLYILRGGVVKPRIELLGLSGWARSGKDTVAAILKEKGYVRHSFADPMREALYRLDPKVDFGEQANVPLTTALGRDKNWEQLKTFSTEIRGLMQRMGTEVGRNMFGENFWVDQALDQIPDGGKVVFADVRFPNEADAIRKLGGKVVRIGRAGVGPANDHISETALDRYEFDLVISNNGTLEDLEEKVKGLGL